MSFLKKTFSRPQFWVGVALVYLFFVFARAIRMIHGEPYASPIPVWGDWSAHFTMATAMAYRSLLLKTSPLLINAPFHYPFLANLISALLIRAGIPFFACFWVPSYMFTAGAIIFLFSFLARVFKRESAAALALGFFLLNGGLGFIFVIRAAFRLPEPWTIFKTLPDITEAAEKYPLVWTSVIRSLLLPQRAFQLGFFLGLVAIYLLWTALHEERPRIGRWLGAGVIAGLLPMSHLHSFGAVGIISAFWMWWDLDYHRAKNLFTRLQLWGWYGLPAVILAGLQLKFLPIVSFTVPVMKFNPGWYSHTLPSWILFWIVNWGPTLALAVWGFRVWWQNPPEGDTRLKIIVFTAPFVLLFIILNLVRLQPWVWDNTKIVAWVSVGVSGLAAWGTLDLWRRNRLVTVLVCGLAWLSGAYEAYRVADPRIEVNRLYTAEECEAADWVRENTEPNSIWLTGHHHNNWLYNLTGRQVLVVYEGWIWSHGYIAHDVQADLENLLHEPRNEFLLDKYKIDYAAIGQIESMDSGIDPGRYLQTFDLIKQFGSVMIFKRKRPTSRASGF